MSSDRQTQIPPTLARHVASQVRAMQAMRQLYEPLSWIKQASEAVALKAVKKACRESDESLTAIICTARELMANTLETCSGVKIHV